MKLMLRLMIMTLSIACAFFLYNHFYTVDINTNLNEELSDYLKKDVEIITLKSLDDEYGVHFKYEVNDKSYEGHAILQKGYNDHYRFSYINFEEEKGRLYFENHLKDGKHHLLVYGNTENTTQFTLHTIDKYLTVETNGNSNYYQIIETVINEESITYYTVTEETDVNKYWINPAAISENKRNGFINNGPKEIVMMSCGLVVMIGFITSFMFTKELNLLEQVYGKITGDPLYRKR